MKLRWRPRRAAADGSAQDPRWARLLPRRRRSRSARFRRRSVRLSSFRPRRPGRRGVLLGLLAAVALVAGGGYLLLRSDLFRARDVTVTGAHRVPAAEIRAVAAVPTGSPLIRLDLGSIGARIVALPAVASVRVIRSWPHTVRLEVVERTPLLAVSRGNGYALVDATGVPFATVATPPKTLPIAALDRISPDDPATRSAIRVLGALPPSVRKETRLLTAATADGVTLLLRDGRSVVWGSADSSDLKARILAVLLHRKGSLYDVSAPDIVTVAH